MPPVSVIIPAYNAASFVHGAIDSVLGQTFQDFEIIVVDDGSKDATREAVESYLSDSRVHYLCQENRGLPGARNAGAKVSRGDYLAFLDADDFFAPNALECMLKAFQSTDAQWLNVGVLKLEGENRTVRHPKTPEGDLLLAILDDDFITRSPFYPRQEFFSVGMYDEEIRNREDWDINIRMIAAGKRFVTVDEPLYHYTRTEGSITTGNRRRLYSFTEMLLRKHHKRLADGGNKEAARLYAKNLWDLARRYFYEVRDPREGFRCAWESFRYDPSFSRFVHPLIHLLETARNRR
jgi:glycosyltransferase involved in cell wall biosynthesis